MERDPLHRLRRRQADGIRALYPDGRLNDTWHYDELGRLVHQVEGHPLFDGSNNRPWNVKVLCYGTAAQIRGSVGMHVARRREGARTLHAVRRLIAAGREAPGAHPPRVSYEVLEGEKVWAGRDPNDPGVSVAACDRQSLASLQLGSNPLQRVHASTAEFRHRPNGTLEVDEYFIYNHDYRDRLVKVLDRVGRQRNVPEWVTYYYDALGRLVFIEPFHADLRQYLIKWGASLNMEDLGGRRTLRLLYDGQHVIEELEYRENQPGLLARYVWGPGLNELLIMDRREDDRLGPGRLLHRYHFHENGSGEIEFLTALQPMADGQVAFRPKLDTHRLPRVPWSVGLERPQYRIYDRGRTTSPYAGAAVRFDPFSRLTLRDGSGQVQPFPYDTPRDYFFRRELEAGQAQYREELSSFQLKGLLALVVHSLAPIAGVSIVAHPVAALVGGGFSIAADAGITIRYYHNEYTLQQGVTAFGIGAIGGGQGARLAEAIGKVAGGKLLTMGAAMYLTEVTMGAGLDVLLNEMDAEEAFIGNAVGVAVGTIAGYGIGRVATSAMSWLKRQLGGQAARAATSTRTVSSLVVESVKTKVRLNLDFIGMSNLKGHLFAVVDLLAEAAATQRKARSLLDAWEHRKFHVTFEDRLLATLGKYARGRYEYELGLKVLHINPFDRHGNLRSTADIASTLIHEYTHWRGGGERRAWVAQYLFLKRLGPRGWTEPRVLEIQGLLTEEHPIRALDEYFRDVRHYSEWRITGPIR